MGRVNLLLNAIGQGESNALGEPYALPSTNTPRQVSSFIKRLMVLCPHRRAAAAMA